MYERDYILRLITQVGQVIGQMLHEIREQRPEDALETSRDAVRALTDLEPALIDAMTPDGLVTFLSAGGSIDVLRARMLAEVLETRAEAYAGMGTGKASMQDRSRAAALVRAALPDAEGEEACLLEELRIRLEG